MFGLFGFDDAKVDMSCPGPTGGWKNNWEREASLIASGVVGDLDLPPPFGRDSATLRSNISHISSKKSLLSHFESMIFPFPQGGNMCWFLGGGAFKSHRF